MTWGRFAAGTRVWHLVDPGEPRETLCGRRFEKSPFRVEIDLTLREMSDACHRCAALASAPRARMRLGLRKGAGA